MCQFLLLLLSSGCEIAEAITLGSNECSEKTGVTEGRSEILPDVNEAPPMALLAVADARILWVHFIIIVKQI